MAQIDPRELGLLRWRCRRGIRELDVLLRRYVDDQFCSASPADQNAFRHLLDGQDTEIYAYCTGQLAPPTAEISALIQRITAQGRPADDR